MKPEAVAPLGLSKSDGLEIHTAMMAGDPTAQARLVTLVLKPLVRYLNAKFVEVKDQTLIYDAATDAILSYLKNPQQFNPAKRSLSGYLKMSAEGDLKNALDKEQRRLSKITPLDDVEESIFARNTDMEATENDNSDVPSLVGEELRKTISDPIDQSLVELIANGERKTNVYAEVLNIMHLPIEQQRRLVKQNKDRLTKKLRRLGVKLSENSSER
ncbi:MAG TPA: hypothetical protein V6C81_25905 [Planktothrix sp.]